MRSIRRPSSRSCGRQESASRYNRIMSQIGFIGLGIMGKPMSKNLLKAGHSLVVYDVVAAGIAEVTPAGAQAGDSCADTAARSEIVITMLPDGPEVETAVLGSG